MLQPTPPRVLPGKVCSGFPESSTTKQSTRVVPRFNQSRNDPRAARLLALITCALVLIAPPAYAQATDASTGVTEPAGYRTDNYRTPVPSTLAGAKAVLTPEAAKRLSDDAHALFVDVYPRAPKPPNLPASTVWRDPPHRSIKGALWLPNVGYGVISADTQSFFDTQLARLTTGDKSGPVVFFCLRDCWMSWNAGKRAIAMGYTSVYWLPDGTDGWEEAGYEVTNIEPVK